jgi:hypothetical protein
LEARNPFPRGNRALICGGSSGVFVADLMPVIRLCFSINVNRWRSDPDSASDDKMAGDDSNEFKSGAS